MVAVALFRNQYGRCHDVMGKRSVHAVLIHFMSISLPAHLPPEQASMDIFIPMQFCPPHFGTGSVHVVAISHRKLSIDDGLSMAIS